MGQVSDSRKLSRFAAQAERVYEAPALATFLDDPVGPATYDFFGTHNYMWASDFPHSDSTWPRLQEVIKADFAKVPEDVTRKIVFENAAKLYHLGA